MVPVVVRGATVVVVIVVVVIAVIVIVVTIIVIVVVAAVVVIVVAAVGGVLIMVALTTESSTTIALWLSPSIHAATATTITVRLIVSVMLPSRLTRGLSVARAFVLAIGGPMSVLFSFGFASWRMRFWAERVWRGKWPVMAMRLVSLIV